MLINNNPKFSCEATGRTKRYVFNWVGGGYNDVWAVDAEHAIKFAEHAYNAPKVRHDKTHSHYLRVEPSSVRLITDHKQYDNSRPLLD